VSYGEGICDFLHVTNAAIRVEQVTKSFAFIRILERRSAATFGLHLDFDILVLRADWVYAVLSYGRGHLGCIVEKELHDFKAFAAFERRDFLVPVTGPEVLVFLEVVLGHLTFLSAELPHLTAVAWQRVNSAAQIRWRIGISLGIVV